MEMESKYDLNRISKLLDGCEWRWAKTYLSVPHEYVVRGKCNLTDSQFLHIVHAQREIGVHERWGKYNHPYLYVDGYKYWTMGDTFDNTTIINRQKVFGEFDNIQYEEKYTDKDLAFISSLIAKFGYVHILDAGCGNGNLIKSLSLSPGEYIGIDPSRNAIKKLVEQNRDFKGFAINKSFEECVNLWKNTGSLIVSIFGSPSYIMTPYLHMVADGRKQHFLMFYKEGYNPYDGTHIINRNRHEIKNIFPNSFYYSYDNYYIVSSIDLTT
jgi:SAM-dependent methyltransferase